MGSVQRAGLHFGRVLEWGVGLSKNGVPEFLVKLHVLNYHDGKDWSVQYPEGVEIVGRFYPISKEKKKTASYDMLKEVFGWDGKSLEGLHNANFKDLQVTFDVRAEMYNGREQLKMSWLYPATFEGHKFERAAGEEVAKMGKEWDSILAAPVVPDAKPGATPPVAGKAAVPGGK